MEDSERDVRHFELEDPCPGINYQVGDSLEILPTQNPAAVDASIEHCKLDPDCYIMIMSYFATAEREKRRLKYLASPEGRDDLNWYNQKEKRTVLEVLQDFPSVQMPFEWLVQLTPPLKKRAFSISSSPLAHPNQIHLTVSIVSWLTPLKRKTRNLGHLIRLALTVPVSVLLLAW
ncbi:NADPH-dependent diflavin oxidoreductase 1 [Panicum miliaceum]|uniref:NADPH-dependent diflavin oxidoreductase 1 n=1 Tax=Panicum miliaceum TaxID=4540 RepID=A0A3L6S0C4_PANMI|nr:NADPH-dependent diflavin oxidoreductase 1 [Panicum miliaceum]